MSYDPFARRPRKKIKKRDLGKPSHNILILSLNDRMCKPPYGTAWSSEGIALLFHPPLLYAVGDWVKAKLEDRTRLIAKKITERIDTGLRMRTVAPMHGSRQPQIVVSGEFKVNAHRIAMPDELSMGRVFCRHNTLGTVEVRGSMAESARDRWILVDFRLCEKAYAAPNGRLVYWFVEGVCADADELRRYEEEEERKREELRRFNEEEERKREELRRQAELRRLGRLTGIMSWRDASQYLYLRPPTSSDPPNNSGQTLKSDCAPQSTSIPPPEVSQPGHSSNDAMPAEAVKIREDVGLVTQLTGDVAHVYLYNMREAAILMWKDCPGKLVRLGDFCDCEFKTIPNSQGFQYEVTRIKASRLPSKITDVRCHGHYVEALFTVDLCTPSERRFEHWSRPVGCPIVACKEAGPIPMGLIVRNPEEKRLDGERVKADFEHVEAAREMAAWCRLVRMEVPECLGAGVGDPCQLVHKYVWMVTQITAGLDIYRDEQLEQTITDLGTNHAVVEHEDEITRIKMQIAEEQQRNAAVRREHAAMQTEQRQVPQFQSMSRDQCHSGLVKNLEAMTMSDPSGWSKQKESGPTDPSGSFRPIGPPPGIPVPRFGYSDKIIQPEFLKKM